MPIGDEMGGELFGAPRRGSNAPGMLLRCSCMLGRCMNGCGSMLYRCDARSGSDGLGDDGHAGSSTCSINELVTRFRGVGSLSLCMLCGGDGELW